jgi:hypothetical protein
VDRYGGGPFSDNYPASRGVLTESDILLGTADPGHGCAINARRTGRCVWLINADFFLNSRLSERL